MISKIKETKVYIENEQYKMNLLHAQMVTNNHNVKNYCEINKKNLFFFCIDFSFQMFETIEKE